MQRPMHTRQTSASILWMRLVPFVLACCAAWGAAMAAAIPVPAQTGHVVNQTWMISTQQAQALEAKLAAFEKRTGRRIAILLVENPGDENLEQFSNRVFESWKLGAEGVLILVTAEPYNERITPGRGLARILPRPILQRILSEDMSFPRVRIGDIAGELNGGVDRIMQLESGQAMPPPSRPQTHFRAATVLEWFAPPAWNDWLIAFVGLFFIYIVVSGVLAGNGALLRGSCTAAAVAIFLLWLGSGIVFALGLAALAFYLGVLNKIDPDDPRWASGSQQGGGIPLGRIAWLVLGALAGSTTSSGGNYRGGGGGFSGGGASGRW